MRELVTRRRSPLALVGTMVAAWVVTVGTLEASDSAQGDGMGVAMALVMVVGLVVSAACLVLLLVQSFRR